MWSAPSKRRLIHMNEWVEKLIHSVIFISILVVCLETFEELNPYRFWFTLIDSITIIIFSIEYCSRCFIAYKSGNFKKYVFSPLGIIDFISIFPYYLPGLIDMRFVKILRLFRLFSIFKLYRYSEHLQTIFDVIHLKKGDLIATLFSVSVLVLFCSCFTFYLEHDAQPYKYKNILSALWWGVSTLTTIGYGDIYPITPGGKIIASFLSFMGVGLIAIYAAILSSGFSEVMTIKKKGKERPHFPKTNFSPPERSRFAENDYKKDIRED